MPLSGKKEIILYDNAVQPEYQRKGIDKQLNHFLTTLARSRGITTTFVEAEESDEHTVVFYHSSEGEEMYVRHFNFTVAQ